MQPLRRTFCLSLAAGVFCALGLWPAAGSPARKASDLIVACRVLEVETSAHPQLTLVVFHHREDKDRDRLGTLLKQLSGASVAFQAADGTWHDASVVRLKSCFGRGLLLFATGEAKFTARDTFLLKFPAYD